MNRAPAGVWVLVGIGLVAFGSSPVLIRLAGDAPALALAAWRTSVVALALAPFALGPGRGEILALSRRDWLLVAAAGVLLGLHFIGWIVSVQLTSVASAAVLVTTSPVFLAVLGGVLLGETTSRRAWGAILVAMGGAAMIGLSEPPAGSYPNPAVGNALALGAAVLISAYFLIGRAVRPRLGFVTYFWSLNVMAALTCLLACLWAGVPLGLPLPAAALAVAMGLGPGLAGHGSFVAALRYLPAAWIGLLGLAEPILASVAAWAGFGEVPQPLALAGMALVLGSIAVVVSGDRSAPAPNLGASPTEGDPESGGAHEQSSR